MTTLRLAIVGAGPAGIYAADILLKAERAFDVSIDLFEQLPAPYGLVRYGVAPDHPRIKGVITALREVLDRGDIRIFGNVEFGRDITLDDLKRHYNAVIFATGAVRDATLDIPEVADGDISEKTMVDLTRELSSDEFEGRMPGTEGGQMTVELLTERFKAAGLEPGNNGSWTQDVPLVEITGSDFAPLTINGGDGDGSSGVGGRDSRATTATPSGPDGWRDHAAARSSLSGAAAMSSLAASPARKCSR